MNVVCQVAIHFVASSFDQPPIYSSHTKMNLPAHVVEIPSLMKRTGHVTVFEVLPLLAGEVDEPILDAELFLHTSCMLLRCSV